MAASSNNKLREECQEQEDVNNSTFAKMEEKSTTIEQMLVRMYEANVKALMNLEVCQENRLKRLKDGVKQTEKTSQVIQGAQQQRGELSALYQHAVKRKDADIYSIENAKGVAAEQQLNLGEEKKALDADQVIALKKLENLEKQMKLYKEAFALDVKKNERQLMFIFKNVNRDDPEKAYFFLLTKENDKFKIDDCSHHGRLLDMDALLDELNSKNYIGHFVCEMRKRFRVIANEYRPAVP